MKKNKWYQCYAGVGARSTPVHILNIMTELASKLEDNGWTLRSGGATGADTAFEKGISNNGNKEIFTVNSLTGKIGEEAYATVDRYHPAPSRLSSYARKLMARNAFQVLGPDLRQPSHFVICWAPESKQDEKGNIMSVSGGTGQAVRIAYDNDIEVFNLNDYKHFHNIQNYINED